MNLWSGPRAMLLSCQWHIVSIRLCSVEYILRTHALFTFDILVKMYLYFLMAVLTCVLFFQWTRPIFSPQVKLFLGLWSAIYVKLHVRGITENVRTAVTILMRMRRATFNDYRASEIWRTLVGRGRGWVHTLVRVTAENLIVPHNERLIMLLLNIWYLFARDET